ncbi:hypothetical protein [uncultured Kocuria sp.]|uniref:putative acetyltransferase n=1 Tax=uncultured Kocuria sp. TaxID=259305 RepID=UPI00261127AC|nr:hypothetical protein [uncultured Kocuria sp.]
MEHPTSGSTSPSGTSSSALGVLAGLPPGTRVSVRYALPADDASGLPLTDALGELLAADEESVTVRTRRGDVLIGAGDLRAARVVPPAPPRRRPRGD